MLRRGYNKIKEFASHPRAIWLLSLISFAESSFFPLPPDPLYIVMILQRPKDIWKLTGVCVVASVVGGLLGYYIGYALYESIGDWIITTYSLQDAFAKFQTSFQKWGFWIIALKGLTPIPYKVVTIFSGIAQINLSVFIIASIIARSSRFLMLALLLRYAGPEVQKFVDKNLGLVTLMLISTLVIGFAIVKYL